MEGISLNNNDIKLDLSDFQTDLETFMKDYAVQYTQPVAVPQAADIVVNVIDDYETNIASKEKHNEELLKQQFPNLNILGTNLGSIMPAEEISSVKICHLCSEEFAVGLHDWRTICPKCQKAWKILRNQVLHDPLEPILD